MLGSALLAAGAQAQPVEIKDAWIRGTVAGQKATGAFMSLTSRSPARLVAAAVGNCLSASLLFCLRSKFKQNPGPLRASVTGQLARNEHGRYRIGGFEVRIELAEDSSALQHLDRCMAQLEDFCVVAESIRKGIPVSVKVVDAAGRTVHEHRGDRAEIA